MFLLDIKHDCHALRNSSVFKLENRELFHKVYGLELGLSLLEGLYVDR